MRRLLNYCIQDTQTIKDGIAVIQGNYSRCTVVLNKNSKVVGVFSQGDALRTILQGVDVHTPLKRVIRPTFISLHERDLEKAYSLFKEYGFTLIPIVSQSYELEGVITIFDVLDHLAFVKEKT